MKEKMNIWFKNNWFKILIIILIVIFCIIYFLNNRYYFMHLDGNTIFKCNKFTGDCRLERIKF